jgi:phospholipid/cholesterol/gamma-HCH transport system substrate-binding protein
VVELTPRPGQGKAPPLPAGATITETSVPPKYSDLFASLNKLVSAIDPEDAKILTHELAVGWDGRAESLRQIITGADQLTTTFAENSELLDGLTKDLGTIGHVLAQNRGDLGAGIDNLAVLTNALSQVRREIAQLRDQGPGVIARVNDLFDKMGPDFDCSLDTLGAFFPALSTPAHLRELRDTLAIAPQLSYVLDKIIGVDEGRAVLNVSFLLTVKKQATLEYQYPLSQPKVGKIPNCPDGRQPGVAAQKAFKGGDPGATIPRHDPDRRPPADQAVRDVAGKSANTPGGPPAWLVYVPPVVALLVLIKVAAGGIPLLSRRRRGRD